MSEADRVARDWPSVTWDADALILADAAFGDPLDRLMADMAVITGRWHRASDQQRKALVNGDGSVYRANVRADERLGIARHPRPRTPHRSEDT